MFYEFDSTFKSIEYTGNAENVQNFKCNGARQYYDLCKILLNQKGFDRHLGECFDGTFYVSKKRYLAGIEYMKNNPFNPR